MRLRVLLDPDVRVCGSHWPELEISGLSADSRTIRPGMLFAALPGSAADGRRFIDHALAQGASAILADPSLDRPLPVPLIVDANPRRRLALMAARFFGRQPDHTVAVTGTNGKTSVASFTRQLWQQLGLSAASLGTLGLEADGQLLEGGLTTPDPVRLHALLAELAGAGTEHVVLEASSHGLDQHRLDGVRLCAAAFTNLSHDHLDYHRDASHYFMAKRRLFAELLPPGGVAVLNTDQPDYEDLSGLCRQRRIEVMDYGERARRMHLRSRAPRGDGQTITFALDGHEHRIDSALVGDFQASNLLAALGLVLASGGDPVDAVAALPRLESPRGRLERVATLAGGAAIFVDYAHTPDALGQALATLRHHTRARLLVVFGCGGDRDARKRPLMGEIAARLADLAIVTDDNPRGEEPAAIRRAILAGCPGALEIGDRARAIREAVASLAPGDTLLIAGKGHETGQIVAGRTIPFDDAVEARLAAAAGAGGRV